MLPFYIFLELTYSFNKHLRNDYHRSDTVLGVTSAGKTRGNKRWSLCSGSSCPLRKPVIQTEKLLKIWQWKPQKMWTIVVHRGQSHQACLSDQERLLLRMWHMTLVPKDEQDLTKRSRKTKQKGQLWQTLEGWKNENHTELKMVDSSEHSKLRWVTLREKLGSETAQYHFWSKQHRFGAIPKGISKSLEQ